MTYCLDNRRRLGSELSPSHNHCQLNGSLRRHSVLDKVKNGLRKDIERTVACIVFHAPNAVEVAWFSPCGPPVIMYARSTHLIQPRSQKLFLAVGQSLCLRPARSSKSVIDQRQPTRLQLKTEIKTKKARSDLKARKS